MLDDIQYVRPKAPNVETTVTHTQAIAKYASMPDRVDVSPPKILGSKTDADKPRYDLLPASALEEVVKALTLGAKEYDPDPETQNWKKVKGWRRRYFAANQRHAWAWQRGEKLNDTGLHHLAHAIVNLMFILEKELTNQE